MKISQQVMGYASSNTYFLSQGNEMILIDPCLDPGYDATRLLQAIKNYTVIGILITHGHFDHISGIDAIVDVTQCPVYMYHQEIDWLTDPNKNLSSMINEKSIIEAPITEIDLGPLTVGPFHFDVISTPGHTAGSISYIIGDKIFDGDFIFKDSVGRTDLPTGSQKDLSIAILDFIKKYQGKNVTLYPGHGPITPLKEEIINNPFIRMIKK